MATTRQPNRRCIETENRNIASLRFFDHALQIQRLSCGSGIETSGGIQTIRYQQDGLRVATSALKLLERFQNFYVRIVWSTADTGDWHPQRVGRLIQI